MYKVIGVDNQVYGPVDAEQIRQWIRERRLAAQSQLQTEGETTFRPLSAFPEFADVLAAAAPAVVPQPTYSTPTNVPATQTNGLAVGGFVCGLLSFCCTCFPLGLVGLILCAIALSQISKQPLQGGKGWAIAGIVLSILGFATTVIFFAFNLFGDILKDLHLE